MKETYKFKDKLIIFLLVLCLLLICFCSATTPLFVKADIIDNKATSVLEDLQRDSNFNIDNYPIDNNDYSLQLIQIAETMSKELLIYIYMPCANTKELQPTTISISNVIVDNDNPNFNLYNLTLQNSNGVFYKYKVEDLQVKEDVVRRYNISELHRKFDSEIDTPLDNNNITAEVACKVAQNWTAYTSDDNKVYYKCSATEVVTITDKYVGFVKTVTGDVLLEKILDSYFIAFSCDYDIDKLVSADVYFQSQHYQAFWNRYGSTSSNKNYLSGYPKYDEVKDNVVTLNADIKQDWSGLGTIWYRPTYSWKQIQSSTEFLSSVDINNTYECGLLHVSTETKIKEESKNIISNSQWVLRFASFDHIRSNADELLTTVICGEEKTIVSNVSILRLEFETDSKIYNLGVVDNKQTPNEEPDIVTKINSWLDWPSWLKTVVKVLICIVVLGVVSFIIWLLFVIIKAIIETIRS